jgi:hypothetical protein
MPAAADYARGFAQRGARNRIRRTAVAAYQLRRGGAPRSSRRGANGGDLRTTTQFMVSLFQLVIPTRTAAMPYRKEVLTRARQIRKQEQQQLVANPVCAPNY